MKNSEINIDDFWKSKELLTAYSEDNYKVVDLSGKSKTCIIFFSSNGLYYPNEVKTLKKEDFNIKCKELEAIIKRKVYLLSEEKNMEQVVEQLIDILSEV